MDREMIFELNNRIEEILEEFDLENEILLGIKNINNLRGYFIWRIK